MGCLMIVLTGAAVGYLQSKRLTARTLFFEEYQKFLSELTLQIRFQLSGAYFRKIQRLSALSASAQNLP